MGFPVLTKTYHLGMIKVKHQGSFPLRIHPTIEGAMPENFTLDRWGPISDSDKDRIAQFPQTREEWVETATDVWFGFEGEGMIFPDHIYEYYNLIVVRPKLIDMFTAVDIVGTRLGCEKE